MTRTFSDAELIASLPGLRRYACRLVGTQDAEDLVNDAVTRALEKSGTFQPGTKLHNWLCRILGNMAVNWRRRGRMRLFEDASTLILIDPSCPGDVRVYALEIMSAVESLPAQYRAAMTECALGSEPKEIATTLGIPVGTAKSRVFRARERLVAQ